MWTQNGALKWWTRSTAEDLLHLGFCQKQKPQSATGTTWWEINFLEMVEQKGCKMFVREQAALIVEGLLKLTDLAFREAEIQPLL